MSTPGTIIRFYDVYDLTPDYKHTRYFTNSDVQLSYFSQHEVSTYTVQFSQYVRVDSGEVKVPFHIKDIHDFTYMSIRNSLRTNDTLDHMYYCFIIDMDYVSDNCTLIKFKVDVMQTYAMSGLFSSTMPNKSYVVRCHNETDDIGDNLVTEPFNVSDYIESVPTPSVSSMSSYTIVVGVCSNRTVTLNGTQINLRPRNYTGRIYTGTTYLAFTVNDAHNEQALIDLIDALDDYPNEIVSIYCVPSFIIGTITDHYVINPTAPVSQTLGLYQNGRKESDGFEGYSPKNKKLFTAPYTMLRVTNCEGEKIDLSFELFDNPDYCSFEVDGTIIGEPSWSIYPQDYAMNESTTGRTNYDYSMSCENFACGSWASDVFGSYLAKNGFITATKMLVGTIGTMVASSMLTGGVGAVAGTGLVTASTASNLRMMDSALYGGTGPTDPRLYMGNLNIRPQKGELTDMARGGGYALYTGWKSACDLIRAKNTGNNTYGTGTKGTTAQINAHKGIYFKTVKIRKYLAEQIDNFFTMYGYAQNKLINIGSYLENHKRPSYAYIQCDDFSLVNGGLENKYKVEIAKIMNSGITFWFGNTMIGNYNANNDPTP